MIHIQVGGGVRGLSAETDARVQYSDEMVPIREVRIRFEKCSGATQSWYIFAPFLLSRFWTLLSLLREPFSMVVHDKTFL
jgi:hypothetical protein